MNAADLALLKRNVDLLALVQSRGVVLKRQGNDYVGLCPFHEESAPSFRVTPSKNLFNCLGCLCWGQPLKDKLTEGGEFGQSLLPWRELCGSSLLERFIM